MFWTLPYGCCKKCRRGQGLRCFEAYKFQPYNYPTPLQLRRGHPEPTFRALPFADDRPKRGVYAERVWPEFLPCAPEIFAFFGSPSLTKGIYGKLETSAFSRLARGFHRRRSSRGLSAIAHGSERREAHTFHLVLA